MNDNDIITPEILIELGFKETGKGRLGRPIYRMVTEGNLFQFQMELGPYPETNGNSGIFSIHDPAGEMYAIPEDLRKKEEWTPEEEERAANHTIPYEAMTQPIAWHMTRVGRLKALCAALIDPK